jgi:hypothetical protein
MANSDINPDGLRPRFEIMPGTKGAATPEDLNDYEYGPLDLRGE